MTCRRCGITRPTLRLWAQRFRDHGDVGLQELSRRPKRSPKQKVFQRERDLILDLRRVQNIGARRIQWELQDQHVVGLSVTTIQKVLNAAVVSPLRRPRRSHTPVRYSRPVPGDRVQMDTMKIVPGVYQYTAVDDCTRVRVLGVFPRRTAAQTLDFLDRVIEEMPFPIQRFQTDRGGEFFAERVQRWFADAAIKFRPIPPRSPHLNGKVERSQLTDLQEFWTRYDAYDPEIGQRIEEWQFAYNWRRPHGSLSGKTPMERAGELGEVTPLRADVADLYDAANERTRHRDYRVDQALAAIWAAQRGQLPPQHTNENRTAKPHTHR